MTLINLQLAKTLLAHSKFKHKDQAIKPVATQGHDHRTFRIGQSYSLRIPSKDDYAAQIEKEAQYLPYLAQHITWPIPTPVYHEMASSVFNRPWIIHQWIEGEDAQRDRIQDTHRFVLDLAQFLQQLHTIDPLDGPLPGEQNFYRGAHPAYYADEVERALRQLHDDPHHDAYQALWQDALNSPSHPKNVWIHGDLEITNLLIKEGQLHAIIDFGNLAIGDPSCDYVMAWTFMLKAERALFLNVLQLDDATIAKAKGWALWKALITVTSSNANDGLKTKAQHTLEALLDLR